MSESSPVERNIREQFEQVKDRIERSIKAPPEYQSQADRDAQFMLGYAESFVDECDSLNAELAEAKDLLSKDPDVDWPAMAKLLFEAQDDRDKTYEELTETRSALERVKGLAQKVVEAEDATETFEAGCNCENQTAGYVCGEPGPCGWRRHIPTYNIKTAVALEAAIDELRAALAPTTSQEEETTDDAGRAGPGAILPSGTDSARRRSTRG